MANTSEIRAKEAAELLVTPFDHRGLRTVELNPDPRMSNGDIFRINLGLLEDDFIGASRFNALTEEAILSSNLKFRAVCGVGRSRFVQTVASLHKLPQVIATPDLKDVTTLGRKPFRLENGGLLVLPNIGRISHLEGIIARFQRQGIMIDRLLVAIDDASEVTRQFLPARGIHQLVALTDREHIFAALGAQGALPEDLSPWQRPTDF